MRGFQNLSIQRKLQLIIMLTVGAALVLVDVASLTYDRVTFQRDMKRDTSILARIVGSNTTAALTFNDTKAAEEILNFLKREGYLVESRGHSEKGMTARRKTGGNGSA